MDGVRKQYFFRAAPGRSHLLIVRLAKSIIASRPMHTSAGMLIELSTIAI